MTQVPPGGGSSLLAQYLKVEKDTGKTPPKLEQYRKEKAPECLQYIFDLFNDFYCGGEFSYSELESWQRTMNLTLEWFEADTIRLLWLEKRTFEVQQQMKANPTNPPRRRKQGRK
ncbi:hypothetical protein [Hafnia phage yong3]|nr:hypothetical protein [Hafnia phage yong3]